MPENTAAATPAKKLVVSQFEPIGTPVREPTDLVELIRARAYQLYEMRGRQEGQAQDDWLQAEIEVLTSQSNRVAA